MAAAAAAASAAAAAASTLFLNRGATSMSSSPQLLLHLKSGLRSGTSYSCQGGLGFASISKVVSGFGGGGGKGFFGGWGGGGGGGDGSSGVPAAGEGSVGAPGGEASGAVTEDVILLNVGGMSCGGCSAAVKRILEAQPQVKEATVDLATETAVVKITTVKPVAASRWEVVKHELGESFAKQLTTAGFKSSIKEDGDQAAAPAA